jgi:hypothetical protein
MKRVAIVAGALLALALIYGALRAVAYGVMLALAA